MVMPSIGMRLCVNERAVPLEELEVRDADGNLVTKNFVLLNTRAAKDNLRWLEEPLGIYRVSTSGRTILK